MPVATILLAAGASQRLGLPKQLLDFQGETLIGRALRLAEEAGAIPVVTVLGAHHEKIGANLRTSNVFPVVNGAWAQGIASSIHAGLRAIESIDTADSAAVSGVLMLTCDQPRLTANHLIGLIGLFEAQSAPTRVASSYAGIQGTPAIFPRSDFADLYALHGDQGARKLFSDTTHTLLTLPFPGGEVDIDLPGDLVHLETQTWE